MTTQLVAPDMLELSGVPVGANVEQLDGTQGWMVMKAASGRPTDGGPMTTKDDTGAAPAETSETSQDLAAELAAAKAENERLAAELEAAKAGFPAADDDDAEDDDEETAAAKALDGLPDAVREVLKAKFAAASDALTEVAKMRDAAALAAAAAHVEEHYAGLPTGDGFPAVVKSLSGRPEWTEVDRVLKAAAAAVALAGASETEARKGRHEPDTVGGTASAQLAAITKSVMAADPTLTQAQARVRAYESTPGLAAAIRAEAEGA